MPCQDPQLQASLDVPWLFLSIKILATTNNHKQPRYLLDRHKSAVYQQTTPQPNPNIHSIATVGDLDHIVHTVVQ